ncbi:MAG: EAL domain-containing protein, partial [Selenomonas sp.]|nr:EAL domain-containing protein [Selenomonas sp.]
MSFWLRLLIVAALAWTQLAAAGLCADFLRPTLRIGFTDKEGEIWQDSRLLYHGAAYEYSETISTYMSMKNSYTNGTMEENLLRLKAGSIDLIMIPDGDYITGYSEPAPADQPSGTISVALGRGIGWLLTDANRPEFAEELRQTVFTINEVNNFYQSDLQEKYHTSGTELKLTDEEKAYLAAHPVVQIMVSPKQPPYTYLQNGQPQGIIAHVIKRIEQDLGLTLAVVPENSHQDMMESLTNGDIDLVMDFYTDYNWARAHNADLTIPYLTLNYVSVLRKDKPLPENPIIACARAHFYTQDYIERAYPPEQLRYYDDVADCMAAVNNGEADMTFVKSITAQSDIFQGNYYNLYTNGNIIFSHKVSMAVSNRADPILIRILNKEIAHIPPKDITSLVINEVYNVQSKDTLQAFVYRNPFTALFLLGGILLAIIMILLYVLWLRRAHNTALWQRSYMVTELGVYNLHWFLKELPLTIAAHPAARESGELFVMVISAQRIAFLKELYGTKVFAEAIKTIIEKVTNKLPWILLYGLSAEITHVYLLCQKPTGYTLHQAAERIEKTAHIVTINDVPTSFTYHIGICPVPRHGSIDAELLMDNAMMARNEGISQNQPIGLFNTVMHDEMLKHQQIELYMEKALENDEFEIYLQAKYDMNLCAICGAEALIRWQSPEMGFLTPNHFINLFERNGFILKLDYYVLKKISATLQDRLKKKLPVVPISVNQSGLHISERGYLANMQAIAEQYKLPRKLVELELTETTFIDLASKTEKEDALHITRRLKSMGYALSMDDFCTGYSSIAMLRTMPMDVMKIDRSMLLSAETSERALIIFK